MEYKNTRGMSIDIRDMIDKHRSRDINRQKLTEYIRELLIVEENRKKVFRAKGLSSTLETVLGKERLELFKEILKELGYDI